MLWLFSLHVVNLKMALVHHSLQCLFSTIFKILNCAFITITKAKLHLSSMIYLVHRYFLHTSRSEGSFTSDEPAYLQQSHLYTTLSPFASTFPNPTYLVAGYSSAGLPSGDLFSGGLVAFGLPSSSGPCLSSPLGSCWYCPSCLVDLLVDLFQVAFVHHHYHYYQSCLYVVYKL